MGWVNETQVNFYWRQVSVNVQQLYFHFCFVDSKRQCVWGSFTRDWWEGRTRALCNIMVWIAN